MKQNSLKIPADLTGKKALTAVLVLIIYAVGVAGMISPLTNGLFIKLIPAVIMLSLALCLLFHQPYDAKTIVVFFLIAAFSWIIEAAGVATGVIFGSYSYGPALGMRFFDTPVIIGLNWLLLIYGTAALTGDLKTRVIIKVLIASLLMVAFDVVVETMAPQLDMWRFDGETAPFRNYIAWFVISALLHSLLKLSGIKIHNPVAKVVFVVQFVFFLLLATLFHFTV